ncbi:MAG: CotH kinase family protein [Bacteroidetes bacterium]|nr:CotH kinase family protein [Bacteroidota bacterium]
MKNNRLAHLWLIVLFCGNLHAQTFTSSNLPIIVINTNGKAILDEPKITADMGIINNAPGVQNKLTDPFSDYVGKIGIEFRGSTSQSFPKKPYGIETRDAIGNGIDAALLGLPPKDDWVLFAPYNDKSLMRDALAYHLGRSMGRYASRAKFFELVINGQYEGIYILLEKIKRDKSRVDIAKLDPTEISGDDLTGGYIVKIDKSTGSGGDGWSSSIPPTNRNGSQTIFFLYDYPKSTDIVPQQKAYIKNYMDSFESALKGTSFKDPVNGYAKYIDVDSFIDFLIMNEVSKNADGYRLSTYLYKKKDSDGGKIYMGPIWDFNLGFGNVDYCTQGNPEGFVYKFNEVCGGDYWLIPFWWDRLLQDPSFQIKLGYRWQTLRAGPLKTTTVLNYIDSVSTVLNVESQQRNFQRWPVLGEYVWPNYFVGATFQSEVNWLKDWVSQRLAWLDLNMPLYVTGVETFQTSVVYPNPNQGTLAVDITTKEEGIAQLEIINSVGGAVRQRSFVIISGKNNLNLDLSDLSKGIYFCRITLNGLTQTHRFVISP